MYEYDPFFRLDPIKRFAEPFQRSEADLVMVHDLKAIHGFAFRDKGSDLFHHFCKIFRNSLFPYKRVSVRVGFDLGAIDKDRL